MEERPTRLAAIIRERRLTYTSVAEEACLQPRTVRQIATGETPIDRVEVGTVRRIAAALSVPVSALIEGEAPRPGDPSLARVARLSAAVREVMWSGVPAAYASPVEAVAADEITELAPGDFFADMPDVDAGRG